MKNKKFIVVGLQLSLFCNDSPKWKRYPLGENDRTCNNPNSFPTMLGARRFKKKLKKFREEFLIEHFLNKNGKLPKKFKNKKKELLTSWYKSTKYKIIQLGDDE